MAEKFKISNLDLYYGDFHALKNINMSIASNEITAFIGPSGCGKSTFLKSLNRMNDLVEGCKITGSVLLDGEDRAGCGSEWREDQRDAAGAEGIGLQERGKII